MRFVASALVLFSFALLAGCGHESGYPPNPVLRPAQISDFATLYSRNCAACHGPNGQNGPAMDLANPEYQALIDDATLRKWISGGMPGTEMPAFAQSAGGMLTDVQIGALVAGMRKAWALPNVFGAYTPPPYAQTGAGDAARGRQTYAARCANCHKSALEDLTSPNYLALVSDQALRSIIIAGRPDIHQMDWRMERPAATFGQANGTPTPEFVHPLSNDDVNDIVTYLSSLRGSAPVAPAANAAPSQRPAASGQAGRQKQ